MSSAPDSDWTSAYTGRSAIVTGGCGFIGSAIARALVDAGADVTVVDSMDPEGGANAANLAAVEGRFRFVEADYSELVGLPGDLAGTEFLFHLAGRTSHAGSMADPEADLASNQVGFLRLLEACRAHAPEIRIVLASTRQVYGRPRGLPVSEDHLLNPPDNNAVHKIAAEHYLRVYAGAYRLRGTCLRLTNTYGPGMRIMDNRQMFLGIWVRSLLEGEPFEVWGRDIIRDFTYVDDCSEAFLLAATREEAVGRTYNLGAAAPITLGELADTLVAINGGGRYVEREIPEERRAIDIGDFHADWRRIAADLGWAPATPLEDGLRRTLDWYRGHRGAYL